MKMRAKKISMIILLVICIGALIYGILKIYDKAVEQSIINGKIQENRNASENEIIEIKDEYFIGATNDMYYNVDNYVGKTIKMQGLLYAYDVGGETCYAVVRNSPGCCGNDGLAGLDIKYDGKCPPENTWVEIVGVVDKEEWQDGYNPIVNVTSMTRTEPGQAFVTN